MKHPDAPMLIIQVKGKAKIACYSETDNKMYEVGWIDMRELTGYTIGKFDWEAHINGKRK